MLVSIADSLQRLHQAHAVLSNQLAQSHDALNNHLQAQGNHLAGIRQHLAAPTEIIRDRAGRATGARKVIPSGTMMQ